MINNLNLKLKRRPKSNPAWARGATLNKKLTWKALVLLNAYVMQ